ncbi:hypothetical protein Slin14017_G018500 [Septoria linicola]|nr:hypothetical protein Slin14017_G018500 [Septoria linicola]
MAPKRAVPSRGVTTRASKRRATTAKALHPIIANAAVKLQEEQGLKAARLAKYLLGNLTRQDGLESEPRIYYPLEIFYSSKDRFFFLPNNVVKVQSEREKDALATRRKEDFVEEYLVPLLVYEHLSAAEKKYLNAFPIKTQIRWLIDLGADLSELDVDDDEENDEGENDHEWLQQYLQIVSGASGAEAQDLAVLGEHGLSEDLKDYEALAISEAVRGTSNQRKLYPIEGLYESLAERMKICRYEKQELLSILMERAREAEAYHELGAAERTWLEQQRRERVEKLQDKEESLLYLVMQGACPHVKGKWRHNPSGCSFKVRNLGDDTRLFSVQHLVESGKWSLYGHQYRN